MNKYLIISISVVLAGLLIFFGIKSKKIAVILSGIGAFFMGIVAFLFKSNRELKAKSKEQELQIGKQKDVVKAHDKVLKDNEQIKQDSKDKQTKLENVVKETQASADVKKSIDLGNDILSDFNSR